MSSPNNMKNSVLWVDIDKVKSPWYKNILEEWTPDQAYIEFIKKKMAGNGYMAPIVVVKEKDDYYVVNGHHRYYAYLVKGMKKIKCILLDGTFAGTEPLRKAEVLLKEFDQRTDYKYQLSGYLDRWAASAEEHGFINQYRPTYRFRLARWLKKILGKRS